MKNTIKTFLIKHKRKIKTLLKLAVSLVLVFLIIFKVNWGDVLENVLKIKIWHVLVYASIILIGIGISALKWKKLADLKGIQTTIKKLYIYYLTGTFINNFMPSFIGGDTYRAYKTGQDDNRYVESASVVLMDRITGFIGLMILILIFSLLNYKNVIHNQGILFVNLAVIAVFMADYAISITRNIPHWKKIEAIIPEFLKKIFSEVNAFRKNKQGLRDVLVLGVVFNFIGVGLANLAIFYFLDIHIALLDFFSVIFTISIISALPVSINNIGIKEWAYIYFFGFFGIESSLAVSVAILGRFLQMLISFLALPVYLKDKGILKNLGQDKEISG